MLSDNLLRLSDKICPATLKSLSTAAELGNVELSFINAAQTSG